jgi:hypothetical protein
VTRASQGGLAVIESLRAVGFEPEEFPEHVALAESVLPRRDAARTVLFQNAWTVLPHQELWAHLRGESARRKGREVVRRTVAAVNARRATKLLALTQYMGGLVQERTGRAAEVHSVGTSLDLFGRPESAPPVLEMQGSFALIPGSVQAYKRPSYGLDYLAASPFKGDVRAVVFAGSRVDEDLEAQLAAQARGVGLNPIFATLSRPEVKWAYRNSVVTILPSRLESLGFALGEALYLSPHVAASRIPAHVEVARRLKAEPFWIDGRNSGQPHPPEIDQAALRESWRLLGEALVSH